VKRVDWSFTVKDFHCNLIPYLHYIWGKEEPLKVHMIAIESLLWREESKKWKSKNGRFLLFFFFFFLLFLTTCQFTLLPSHSVCSFVNLFSDHLVHCTLSLFAFGPTFCSRREHSACSFLLHLLLSWFRFSSFSDLIVCRSDWNPP